MYPRRVLVLLTAKIQIMKANIIYKLTSDVYRDNEWHFHHEKTYEELCDARDDLNVLLEFAQARAEYEKEEGHDSCCNVMKRRFNELLPEVDVTVKLIGGRSYYKLTYDIQPC